MPETLPFVLTLGASKWVVESLQQVSDSVWPRLFWSANVMMGSIYLEQCLCRRASICKVAVIARKSRVV